MYVDLCILLGKLEFVVGNNVILLVLGEFLLVLYYFLILFVGLSVVLMVVVGVFD